MPSRSPAPAWPELPLPRWKDTCATLHLWTQIVGKVRLRQTPWINHSWHVTLYVTARGLTTSLVPHGSRAFEMEFDFIGHALEIRTTDGAAARVELRPRTVADFHAETMAALAKCGVPVAIHEMPCEIPDCVSLAEDRVHGAYDPEYAQRFWRALASVHRVLTEFRSGFIGKCSPVHFFWGSFDLAVTRFSGRRAPVFPQGAPHTPAAVMREAYSHEVSSAGFWPGGGAIDYPAFYSYAYPQPEGYAAAPVRPAEACFSAPMGEFLLPYDAVRAAPDPDAALLAFLQSTYEAAANAARWDRAALEGPLGKPGVPRPLP